MCACKSTKFLPYGLSSVSILNREFYFLEVFSRTRIYKGHNPSRLPVSHYQVEKLMLQRKKSCLIRDSNSRPFEIKSEFLLTEPFKSVEKHSMRALNPSKFSGPLLQTLACFTITYSIFHKANLVKFCQKYIVKN
jgi:hypothetical protein